MVAAISLFAELLHDRGKSMRPAIAAQTGLRSDGRVEAVFSCPLLCRTPPANEQDTILVRDFLTDAAY
jgi:hypothetical protein